eukprot:5268044-Pyramimonas_sp.AAC.1
MGNRGGRAGEPRARRYATCARDSWRARARVTGRLSTRSISLGTSGRPPRSWSASMRTRPPRKKGMHVAECAPSGRVSLRLRVIPRSPRKKNTSAAGRTSAIAQDGARTFLVTAGLPAPYWAHAVPYFCLCYNAQQRDADGSARKRDGASLDGSLVPVGSAT